MKLEVGKKYVDGHGRKFSIVAKNPVTWLYIAVETGDKETSGWVTSFTDIGESQIAMNCDKDNLVKEHVEPRTKDVWLYWINDGDSFVASEHSTVKFNDVIAKQKFTITEGKYDV